MNTTIETITPQKAAEYLKLNSSNRPLRTTAVEQMAAAMKSGDWKQTHQGIAFANDGRLLDGQHRLQAVIKSGIPLRCYVTHGLEVDAYEAIDCGSRRSYHERIKLVEDPYENKHVVRAVSAYIRATTGERRNLLISSISETFLERPEGFIFGSQLGRGRGSAQLTSSYISAALAVYHSVDSEKASAFYEQFVSGENLERLSPILRLREFKLMNRGRADAPETYWKASAAMTAHRDGKHIAKLYINVRDMIGNEASGAQAEALRQRGRKPRIAQAS